MVTIGTRSYSLVRGNDERDGLYLELSEDRGKQGMAEVFFSDLAGEFTLNTFGNDVPLEATEWLSERARELLPAAE